MKTKLDLQIPVIAMYQSEEQRNLCIRHWFWLVNDVPTECLLITTRQNVAEGEDPHHHLRAPTANTLLTSSTAYVNDHITQHAPVAKVAQFQVKFKSTNQVILYLAWAIGAVFVS